MKGFVSRNRWFMLLVVLPTVLVAVYYALIASDLYVSEAQFVVSSQAQRPAVTTTLANVLQSTAPSSGTEQTEEVIDYMRSRDALADLSRGLDLRAIYGGRGADWLSRYPMPLRRDRFENLYSYYKHRVSAKLDQKSGLAVIRVEAFAPTDAAAINTRLLTLAEGLVNRLNTRARTRAITEAEQQVTIAQGRLARARDALAAYRNHAALLDPTAQATGALGVATRLVADRAGLQAQLDLMRRQAPANPVIPSLQSRIAALSAQIDAQNGRAVGNGSAISSKLTEYDTLKLEQDFATQMVTAANAQLAMANAEAVRQQFYLQRVVNPNVPDLSYLPNRWLIVATVFGVLLSLYLVGWMFIAGLVEHSRGD